MYKKLVNRKSVDNQLHEEIYNSDNLIEKILTAKKIKYDELTSLFKDRDNIPSDIDTVNIFIDVLSLFPSAYKAILESAELLGKSDETKLMIASNIINLAGHFRNYFATRMNKYTNIYFYYSFKQPYNESLILPDYGKTIYNIKNTNSLDSACLVKNVKSNFKTFKILSNFLPHIYFIDTNRINPLVVPYKYHKQDQFNIIYSNNELAFTLLPYMNNTIILRSTYKDASTIVDRNNLYFRIFKKKSKAKEFVAELNIGFVPFIYSCIGSEKNNIPKAYPKANFMSVHSDIKKVIQKEELENIHYNNTILLKELSKSSIFKENINEQIEKNLDVIDINKIMNRLTESDLVSLDSQISDYQDIKGLTEINNEFFHYRPLNLEFLLVGEEYESLT